MKLMQTTTFASAKLYCLISLICLIILISHIAQLVLIREFIVSIQVCIFPLNMCDIIIYVARWWEKYLSKRNFIKHTCSWRDKLIVLWTLNRQAKIFLRMVLYIVLLSVTFFYFLVLDGNIFSINNFVVIQKNTMRPSGTKGLLLFFYCS